MKRWLIVFLLCTAYSTTPVTADAQSSKTVRTKRMPRRPSMRHFRIGPWISQENIKLKTLETNSNMESQSLGMLGTLSYSYPFQQSRWSRVFEIDMALGSIKGKGSSIEIADELEGQLWMLAGGSAGLLYRSSSHSSLGLALPFAARFINWSLAPGSPLDPDRDFSWSVGLSGYYQNHFSIRSTLHVAITHHQQWMATVWNVAYQYRFK